MEDENFTIRSTAKFAQILARRKDLDGRRDFGMYNQIRRAAYMSLKHITNQMCARGMPLECQFPHRLPSVACSMLLNTQPSQRTNHKDCGLLQVQCTENLMQSPVSFSDFSVSVCAQEDGLIKLQVNVSGTMTDSIFEKVFTKNVAAAQPLPGFRRMKGGKTPDIPKEVALHLIGPSKVKKETIKKIISSTVAEYVQK
ncbi:hypothetical protein ACJX0J_013912, partial [Zea mays]